MALKSYKPTTPSLRFTVGQTHDDITPGKPPKHLLTARKRASGRDNTGRISVRHRGGGVKRHLREVDFLRNKIGIPARVAAVHYDPGRSANIALLNYIDGEKRYIIAPEGLAVGALVMSGPDAEPNTGNALPIEKIPLGLFLHCIEMVPGRGAKIARSAGNSCQLMARENDMATLRMPSGEVRMVPVRCMATIGRAGNAEWIGTKFGKAGRKRWLGIRPTVRGVAMNPVDHPMGGGEGRTSGGSHPRSPWGKLAKGGKTRKPRKTTSKFIVKRRSK
jgi:large subunit ribosomal protein L2